MTENLAAGAEEGSDEDALARRIAEEFSALLSTPSDYLEEGFTIQRIRRQIEQQWGGAFVKLENVGYLAGWAMIECIGEGPDEELHLVLCLMALEALRTMWATVNQLRSALAEETPGYLRTMHELSVQSRFLTAYAANDPDLPGRFAYFNRAAYLDFYRRFAPGGSALDEDHPWRRVNAYYADRYPDVGNGDYGWVYPHIRTKNGPKRRPTFSDLRAALGESESDHDIHYRASSSKVHGAALFGRLHAGPYPTSVIALDSYSSGGVGEALSVMLPLLRTLLNNPLVACGCTPHRVAVKVCNVSIEQVVRAAEASLSANA